MSWGREREESDMPSGTCGEWAMESTGGSQTPIILDLDNRCYYTDSSRFVQAIKEGNNGIKGEHYNGYEKGNVKGDQEEYNGGHGSMRGSKKTVRFNETTKDELTREVNKRQQSKLAAETQKVHSLTHNRFHSSHYTFSQLKKAGYINNYGLTTTKPHSGMTPKGASENINRGCEVAFCIRGKSCDSCRSKLARVHPM